MNKKNNYTSLQFGFLLLLRFMTGWYLLYEGFSKIFMPGWSSAGYLQESKWIFEGVAKYIIAHDNLLTTVDILNEWGLIAIGSGLILGLLTRFASAAGALLLLVYYLFNPPFIGLEYSMSTEGNYLVVNKTLIESVALALLAFFPTGSEFGLDFFLNNLKSRASRRGSFEENNREGDQPVMEEKTSNKRRAILKALVGLPVLAGFSFELWKQRVHESEKRNLFLDELGLRTFSNRAVPSSMEGAETIRIGIIGFGNRAVTLANGLGYMHPDDVAIRKAEGTLNEWLLQDNLRVALVGICDVYDMHADRGLETAFNPLHPGGGKASGLPVKRYRTYQEMIDSKDIDAIMIATPDHHHASITIAAAKAGKHVYCEKAPALNEAELNEMYSAVKNSKIVYQLGHQVPQSEVFRKAKDFIREGVLGKITLVETTSNRNSADGAWIRHLDKNGNPKPGNEKSIDWKHWLGTAPEVPFSLDRFYNWTKYFDYDFGLIGQLFTHEYDAVNQLLRVGIPSAAVASGGIYYWKDNREIPDTLNCVFEFPDKDITLFYSASLASSLSRGRVFMGNDASMELGDAINITVDSGSKRFKKLIESGLINCSEPVVSINQTSDNVDAISSATAKYFASRGLTTTIINGIHVDVTYLHIREWIACIRNDGIPTANIDRAFEEGIVCLMAHKAYIEKRRVEWDNVRNKIL